MWVEVLKAYGISLSETAYKRHYAGIPTPANAANLVKYFNLEVSCDQLVKQKTIETRSFLENAAFPLMPGALDAVKRLYNTGLKLAIVTGASREGMEKTVATYGLGDTVACFVSGDDVIHNKPAPDCYLLAMEWLGVSAEECVAIEDTEHGVNASTAAGIPCLAVPTPMSEMHDFANAIKTCANITDAVKWIIHQTQQNPL